MAFDRIFLLVICLYFRLIVGKSVNDSTRGVPALYQSLGGSGEGYPDPSSRLASRVELPKITISVVEPRPVRNDKQMVYSIVFIILIEF